MGEDKTKLRILIVDDNPIDRELFRRLVAHHSTNEYLFTETASGEEGLDLCRSVRPDCVLLDYNLPDLDGLEFVRQLAAESVDVLSTPVVMLTSEGNTGVAVAAMKAGAQDYLVKDGISRETLHHAMSTAMEKVSLLRKIQEQRTELEIMARTDTLTGLLNRRAFMNQLRAEFERAERYGGALTLIMLDLDHFKVVNDTHGHIVGDYVLRKFAGLILALKRKTDVAGRHGGEEFVMLMPETDIEGGKVLAQRLCKKAAEEEYHCSKGRAFAVTCSIGVAQYQESDEHVDGLLRRSDEALYKAKRAGRNCISY